MLYLALIGPKKAKISLIINTLSCYEGTALIMHNPGDFTTTKDYDLLKNESLYLHHILLLNSRDYLTIIIQLFNIQKTNLELAQLKTIIINQ